MKSHLKWLSNDLFLKEFNPGQAPGALWRAYFRLTESIFREFNPDSRLPDREATRRRLCAASPLYAVQRSLVFDNARTPVAFSYIAYDTEQSPSFAHDGHLCQVHIRVAEPFRRRRIATTILNVLVDIAEELDKTIIQAEVDNSTGRKFCRSLQGEMAHKEVQHRLYLDEVRWPTVEAWLSAGRKKFPDTEFVFFADCPEADLENFCRTYTEIINQRPTGEMEQTIVTTPESRRIEEQDMKKRGVAWYTLISREIGGDISGLTDIMYHPREPHKLIQYFTGVSARHRRKGLAKRLKAEMLTIITKQFPDVEYITTTMAPNNRPMLSINAQLGFRSRKTTYMYQWTLQNLRRQVNQRLHRPARTWATVNHP